MSKHSITCVTSQIQLNLLVWFFIYTNIMHSFLTTLIVPFWKKSLGLLLYSSQLGETALGWIKRGFLDFVDQLGKE